MTRMMSSSSRLPSIAITFGAAAGVDEPAGDGVAVGEGETVGDGVCALVVACAKTKSSNAANANLLREFRVSFISRNPETENWTVEAAQPIQIGQGCQ